jgi:hypothetical protein
MLPHSDRSLRRRPPPWQPVDRARTQTTLRNRGEPAGFGKIAAAMLGLRCRRVGVDLDEEQVIVQSPESRPAGKLVAPGAKASGRMGQCGTARDRRARFSFWEDPLAASAIHALSGAGSMRPSSTQMYRSGSTPRASRTSAWSVLCHKASNNRSTRKPGLLAEEAASSIAAVSRVGSALSPANCVTSARRTAGVRRAAQLPIPAVGNEEGHTRGSSAEARGRGFGGRQAVTTAFAASDGPVFALLGLALKDVRQILSLHACRAELE